MDQKKSTQPLLLRLRDVQQILGVSRTTVYVWLERDPSFPRPVRVSGKMLAWRTAEIRGWVDQLPNTPGSA